MPGVTALQLRVPSQAGLPGQQAPPSVPHEAHALLTQAWLTPHTVQLAPVPQADAKVPGSQPLASQQPPLQEPAVQPQVPDAQASPWLQEDPAQQLSPFAPQWPLQAPPEQPTSAPQTAQAPPEVPQAAGLLPVSQPFSSQQPPAQLQAQVPFEQARLAPQAGAEAQQACPSPPQVSHLPATQACPALHTLQAPPVMPHAAAALPNSQPLPSQQPPGHEPAVQPQVPPEQARPALQAVPPQHDWPLPPQLAQLPPLQFWLGPQALQLPPE